MCTSNYFLDKIELLAKKKAEHSTKISQGFKQLSDGDLESSTERSLLFEIDDLEISNCIEVSNTSTNPNATYFYQSADGDLVFLHSISFKPLLAQAESFTLLPKEITATVLDVETLKVTPSCRQRLPFMQHLPLQCSTVIVELDMKAIVRPEVIIKFLANRAHHRNLYFCFLSFRNIRSHLLVY